MSRGLQRALEIMEENQTLTINYSLNLVNYTSTLPKSGGNYYGIDIRVKLILRNPAYIIALVIGTLALILNTLALLVVTRSVRKTRRQEAHYAFIMSLASSNMLFSFSLILIIINRVLSPIYLPGQGPSQPRIYTRCSSVMLKSLNTTALNAELLSLIGL